MAIYNVICTKHCEYTFRIEAIQCIDNESLDWLGCMCTSWLYKFYNLTKWLKSFKRYFKRLFGCSKLILHSKCPLLGERPKGKYCQTVRMDQMGLKLYYDWEMSSFKMNPHSKHILIANPECPESKTRKCLSILHWLVCKNPLEVVDGGYFMTFKEVP